MSTAQTIINRALRELGVKELGQSLEPEESNIALEELNLLIDSLSLEGLMQTNLTPVSHSLVSGTASYTIGSGGDINTTRPVKIVSAYVRDGNNLDLPIELITESEWNKIPLKDQTSSYPQKLFYRAAFPLGTINLFSKPSAGLTLYLSVMSQISQFATLATTVSLAPGYERMLGLNLAVEIANQYDIIASPQLVSKALQSKLDLKHMNFKPPVSRSALGVGRAWNIYEGPA